MLNKMVPESPGMRFACQGTWKPTGGTVLFQIDGGPDEPAATVLVIHGIPTWSFLWRNVMRALPGDVRSIALDLPGFGLSDRSAAHTFQVRDLAGTVERFIDAEIDPSQPLFLVAHDFGALVAGELISRRGERYAGLVLTNTSFHETSWSGAGGLLRILATPVLGDLSMMLAQPWMLRLAMRPFIADSAVRESPELSGYWYPFEAGFGQALARLYRSHPIESGDFARWRAALRGFSGSSLILWGARDPAFTPAIAADLRAMLEKPELQLFENVSHFLPEERPRAVARRIGAFVLANMR